MMGRPWRYSATPLYIPRPAPGFGEHNRDVLQSVLGYDVARCDDLERRGIIAARPKTAPVASHAGSTVAEMVGLALFKDHDSAYREGPP